MDEAIFGEVFVCGPWEVICDHGVKNDTGAPDVGFHSVVRFFFDDFGGGVDEGSACGVEEFVAVLLLLAKTEVGELGLAVSGDEDILEFDVAVGNAELVDVGDGAHDLAEITAGVVFGKAFGLDGQFIEIAAITEFEEEVDVVAVEVDVEKLGDCAVTDLAMDDQLVLEMREEFGVAKMLEIDDLAGNRFASCDVFALPNASECARTDEVHEFVRADLVRFLTH